MKFISEESKTRFEMIRKEIIIARAIYRQMPPLFVPRRKPYGRKTETALLPRFCTDFYKQQHFFTHQATHFTEISIPLTPL